ncbi:hypothetical protein Bca4012_097582 [Brassica carinata]
MNAIFPEEGMLHFHRVSLEMAYADNFLANRNRSNPPCTEIIDMDDDDDEMLDGNQANLATGKRDFAILTGKRVLAGKRDFRFWRKNEIFGFGGKTGFSILAGKQDFAILAGKRVSAVLAGKRDFRDGAAKGLGLAATVDVVRGKAVGNEANACDNILQPMMKLAICCAVKGVVTSKVGKRATETSSEGSSMDGGC